MPTKSRNYEIAPGLLRFSRAKMYHKRGLFKKLQKPFPKKKKLDEKKEVFTVKKVGGDKNGKERKVLVKKSPKLVLSVLSKKIKRNPKIPKLRSSIQPGTVLILLTGPHRGKRVIFLKQMMKSGLLLITGPLKLNATPIRRVSQAFVIATKTKIEIGSVNIPDHINDDYFKKAPKAADKSKAGIFATGDQAENKVSQQKKTDQKQLDSQILMAIRKHPDGKFLFGYLGSRFSLAKNQQPHKLVY